MNHLTHFLLERHVLDNVVSGRYPQVKGLAIGRWIRIVADAITVRVCLLLCVQRKGISEVLNSIAIIIKVCIVADAIAIGVCGLVSIGGKRIQGVSDTIKISVNQQIAYP